MDIESRTDLTEEEKAAVRRINASYDYYERYYSQNNYQGLEQAIVESPNHNNYRKESFNHSAFIRRVQECLKEPVKDINCGSKMSNGNIEYLQNSYNLFLYDDYQELLQSATILDTQMDSIDDFNTCDKETKEEFTKEYTAFYNSVKTCIKKTYPGVTTPPKKDQNKPQASSLQRNTELNQDIQNIKPRDSNNLEARLGDILQNFDSIKEDVKINPQFAVIIEEAEKNFTHALGQALEGLTDKNLNELEKILDNYMTKMTDLNDKQNNKTLEKRLGDIFQNFRTIKKAVKKEAVKINPKFQEIIKDAENNFTDALERTLEGLTDNNLDELEKNLANYIEMIDLNNEQNNVDSKPSLNRSFNNQNQYDKEDQGLFDREKYNQEEQDLFDLINWEQNSQEYQSLFDLNNRKQQVKVNNNSSGFGIVVN